MLHLVFALLLSGLFQPAYAINECPANQPLTIKQMTPEGVRQWLKINSEELKTVEDVVCCLPQNYLKNYLVSYSGRAGQTGSPESPRVFVFDSQKPGTMILTFNGGDAYLNDPHNIEMGFVKDGKKFEIYDIEFYKRFAQMSEKNPVRCLRCHSEVSGADARPFFHINGSANFVTGPSSCSNEEDELQNRAQKMALDAIIKNPRFGCLDRAQAQSTLAAQEKNHKWTAGKFDENLRKLKNILHGYEKSRFAQLVHDSPDYSKYRFAIVGAERCSNFKASDWLPADVLSKHTVFATLRPELAGVEKEEGYREAWDKLKEDQEGRVRALRRIARTEFDIKRGSFRPAFQSWLCPSDPTFEKLHDFKIPSDAAERALAKFEVDSHLRIYPQNENTDRTAILRYLLDGRGVETSAWTLSFNQKEDLHAFEPIADELIALEPKDTALKEKACDVLKQSSLKAFQLIERSH